MHYRLLFTLAELVRNAIEKAKTRRLYIGGTSRNYEVNHTSRAGSRIFGNLN